MQIRENLLRVIFMLSTIVIATDCCSSRILLLKEHTLQIVNEQRFEGNDYDYDPDDYEQLQLQQQQQLQLQQQQPQETQLPQHILIANHLEFIKNFTDELPHSSHHHDPGGTTQSISHQPIAETTTATDSNTPTLPPFELSLGIFDAAAFEPAASPTTTTTTTTTNEPRMTTPTVTSRTAEKPVIKPPETTASTTSTTTTLHVVDIMSIPCSGQYNTDFCLNRGRCFRYLVGNETLHSCICADGYVGERCESKSLNGAYVPAITGVNKERKILMARIVFSFPTLVAISVIYIVIGAAIVFKRGPKSLQSAAVSRLRREQERRLLTYSSNNSCYNLD